MLPYRGFGMNGPISPGGSLPQRVVRTFLELRDADALRPGARPLPDGVALQRLDPCSVEESRALYRAVGAAWHWRDREAWPDARLATWLADPRVGTWRLDDPLGQRLGYLELVRHPDAAVEIGYFGLVPEAMGQGLGGAFLTEATRLAWRFRHEADGPVARVWLHTCTLDAPQALPNYLARGFRVTGTEEYDLPTA
jgi:GNAT superfamily N-acetyltransferase